MLSTSFGSSGTLKSLDAGGGMKILGWIVVACFALTTAAAVLMVAHRAGAPDQVCSFLVALIGAIATCYGPRILESLTAPSQTS
jgi:hypothetical protein